ncbi:MAG: hypothetical protein DMF82_08130 [Acidobacteria bacterium]|nr:MAG: hypothetical protein DMF82_08130 [Acidobacteriota bacterium]
MPTDFKADDEPVSAPARPRGRRRAGPWASVPGPVARRLRMPVTGMEAEFNVFLDGVEIDPREFWGRPTAFIDAPLLRREKSSFQLPTGGAVYFDRGVIEVVTPVIELAPGCSARVVRNLWEQIAFVRRELSNWEKRSGRHIRLRAYSAHYNVSFEHPRSAQENGRNVRRLAYLLAHILPVPVAVVGTNRRSTGVGVRPRGDRIEVTADFTPDPGLMIATATLVIGIVREVMDWPSYDVALLDRLPVPTVEGVVPGRHTTRKGWLTKDFHFPQSPFTSDVDDPIWKVRSRSGRLSLREIALRTAWYFRRSIRRYADPFSLRMLFSILKGGAPSLLELDDRPSAYEDVGRLCRWGMVLPALKRFETRRRPTTARQVVWNAGTLDDFIASREQERAQFASQRQRRTPAPARARLSAPAVASSAPPAPLTDAGVESTIEVAKPKAPRPRARPAPITVPAAATKRERSGIYSRAASGGSGGRAAGGPRLNDDRRRRERRARQDPIPFPDRRLTRSAYEQVFLKLVSGERLRIGRETYTPIGMKGWYHAVFRRDSDGHERLLTIDQLLKKMRDWQ